MEEKNKKHTTTVDAWRRLWSVGANGENIKTNNNNNKRKRTNTTTQLTFQLPLSRQTNQNKRKHHDTEVPPTNTKVLTQMNLYGKNIDLQDVEEFGDIMTKKPDLQY
jgi:hypothetical protein